jgi:hypothetical protein
LIRLRDSSSGRRSSWISLRHQGEGGGVGKGGLWSV